MERYTLAGERAELTGLAAETGSACLHLIGDALAHVRFAPERGHQDPKRLIVTRAEPSLLR